MTTQAIEFSFGSSRSRQVGLWLILCAVMVFGITVLGGVTRLTHSGLSIVAWEPLAGILPPLSTEAWAEEFSNYKQFPEYQKINMRMDLDGFKAIYWYEYSHRLLGRTIGLVFAIPFIYFLIKRRVDRQLGIRLGVLFVLGGLQGALGWYMVSSGLVARPDVSQYRLTAHLGLAVILYGYMVWLAMSVLLPSPKPWGEPTPRSFRVATYATAASAFILILSGGLVAGLDAGFAYNTYPTMDGEWVPAGMLTDPFGNITTVQFLHRWLGPTMAVLVVLVRGRGFGHPFAQTGHGRPLFAGGYPGRPRSDRNSDVVVGCSHSPGFPAPGRRPDRLHGGRGRRLPHGSGAAGARPRNQGFTLK